MRSRIGFKRDPLGSRAAASRISALAAVGFVLVVVVAVGNAAARPLLPPPPPSVESLANVPARCIAATTRVSTLDRQIAGARRLAATSSPGATRRLAQVRLGRLLRVRRLAIRRRVSACRVGPIAPSPGVAGTPGAGASPLAPGTSSPPHTTTAPVTTSTPDTTTTPAATTAPVTTPTAPGPPVPVIPAPGSRASADRPDERSGALVHLLYVLPSDVSDRHLDTNGVIANSFSASQSWIRQAGGIQFRLDTYDGKPDISFYRMSRTNADAASAGASVRDLIEQELVSAGFDQPNKILLVYYDGLNTTACGSAAWPPVFQGTVGALYLTGAVPGRVPCGDNPLAGSGDVAGYWEQSAAHEILHLAGMVPTCAPHRTLGGHVSDSPTDLMYAGDQPWAPTVLDFGSDDYFHAGIAGCADLSNSPYIEKVP